MNRRESRDIEKEEGETDYRMIQRTFYCHSCQAYFKKLLSREDSTQCPKCEKDFVEEVEETNREEIALLKQADEKIA